MLASHLALHLLSLHDHLASLLILSLAPLREGCTTVPLEEHPTDLINTSVLTTGPMLVSGVLADVLEATLPHRFLNDVLKDSVHVYHALGVRGPFKEDSSCTALEVHVLVIISHQGHHLASLSKSLIVVIVHSLSRFDQ